MSSLFKRAKKVTLEGQSKTIQKRSYSALINQMLELITETMFFKKSAEPFAIFEIH